MEDTVLKNNKALRFIIRTSRKEFLRLLLVTLLNAAASALGVYFALSMRNVINAAVSGDKGATYTAAAIFVGVILAEIILFALARLLAAHISARLEILFRKTVFAKLLKKDYSEITKLHSGEVQNRLFNDVSVVSESVATLIPNVAGLFTRLIGAFVAVLLIDVTFALILLGGGLLMFIFARAFRGIMKKTHKDVQSAGGEVRSFVQESTESILVIKAFGMEDKIEEKESSKEDNHYKKKMRRSFFSIGASTGFSAIINCGYIYAVLWGACRILSGTVGFGYGDFMAIIQLINQIQSPFAGLSGSLSKFYSAIASAERLLEITNLSEDLPEREDTAEIYEKMNCISFSGISFSYDDTPVFEDAEIEIPKGELTLISGISGIGKSTMLKMLMGVLTPSKGEINALCNGEKIKIDSSTRPLFAYVPQGNFLMSGTIRENMLLAGENASDSEILNALKVASAKFFDELPEGLDTVLGERGSGLSEGQIQRLAIARAILSGSPILLLDEATSALDEETEREVLENIMKLRDKTCICISHRSAAREVCDREIYVEDGKIKERK